MISLFYGKKGRREGGRKKESSFLLFFNLNIEKNLPFYGRAIFQSMLSTKSTPSFSCREQEREETQVPLLPESCLKKRQF